MTTRLLLDVRSHKEYCAGHVCGAINIPTPLPPLNKRQVCDLVNALDKQLKNKDKNVGVDFYCKKGIRADLAKSMLGYKNVRSLGGLQVGVMRDRVARGSAKICTCMK